MISEGIRIGSNYYKWGALVLLQITIGICSLILPFKVAVLLFLLLPTVLILLSNCFYAYVIGIFLLPVWSITLTGQAEVAGHVDFRFSDALFLIAGIGWLLKSMINKQVEIRGSYLDFALLAFFFWMFLSIFWCPTFFGGVKEFLRKSNGLFIFYVTINVIRNQRDLDFAMIVWIIAGFLAALFAFHEVITQILLHVGAVSKGVVERWGWLRASALKEGANKLGFFLNICLMMAISRFVLVKRLGYRILLFLSIIVMISALITTLSRNSMIGFVVGTTLLFYLIRKGGKKLILLAAGGVVFFLFVFGPGYREVLFKRYVGLVKPEETTSYVERTEIWGIASRMFAERPIVGTGAGGFLALSGLYGAQQLKSPHNLYVYIVTEFGLIGLLLFLIVVVRFVTVGRKGLKFVSSEKERLVTASLLVGVVVYGAQGFLVNFLLIEGEFWALLGLSAAAIRIYCGDEVDS